MRPWMMAGGAAVLMAMGSARAVEPTNAPAAGKASGEVQPGQPVYAAAIKAEPGAVRTESDRSGYVTRDELKKSLKDVSDRIDRRDESQRPAPQFTDAG